MNKRGVISSLTLICVTVVLFQNCGKGFEVSSTSLSMELPSVSSTSRTLPPFGTFNAENGPLITKGLTDQNTFGEPDGISVSFELSTSSPYLYSWTVDGVKSTTTEPRIVVQGSGKHDVTVEVIDSAGRVSTSRALYSVSRFVLTPAGLYYRQTSVSTELLPVRMGDPKSMVLVGLNTVSDGQNVYYMNSAAVVTIPAANAVSVKELSVDYISVNDGIYYRGVVAAGVSAKDFTVFANTAYAKTSARVFCNGKDILGADAPSFEAPLPQIKTFARDRSKLYSECVVLTEYTPGTFAVFPAEQPAPIPKIGFIAYSGKTYFVDGGEYEPGLNFYEVPFNPLPPAKMKITGRDDYRLVTDGQNFARFQRPATIPGERPPRPRLVLVAGSLNVDLASFRYFESSLYVDKDRVYFYKASDTSLNLLPNANGSTFAALGSGYYKSGNFIFQNVASGVWNAIATPNAGDLVNVDGMVFKNATSVFYLHSKNGLQLMTGANPATITRLGLGFLKDGNNLWYYDASGFALLKGVDAATFGYVGAMYYPLIRDKNKLYLVKSDAKSGVITYPAIEVANPLSIKKIGGSYVYNDTTIYYIDETTAKIVVGVAPGKFTQFPSLYALGSDGSFIFKEKVVPGIDATRISQVGQSEFFRDSTNILSIDTGVILTGANPNSFHLVNADISRYYATDGVRTWFSSKEIPGVDVETFRVTSFSGARDKNYIYSNGTIFSKVP